MNRFTKRKDVFVPPHTCPVCGTRFPAAHRKQRSRKFCSRRCSNRNPSVLHRELLKANRINVKFFDPPDHAEQIAAELRRRFPDLMAHLGRLGQPVQYGFPIGNSPESCKPIAHFAIALPTMKILIDVDALLRQSHNRWRLAYRLAEQDGWKILNPEQALGISVAPALDTDVSATQHKQP